MHHRAIPNRPHLLALQQARVVPVRARTAGYRRTPADS